MQNKLWNFDEPLTDREVMLAFEEGRTMTRRNIAEKLRRSKSPTLVSRMNRLAQEGYLKVEFYTLPNGVDMWLYTMTEKGVLARRELVEEEREVLQSA